MLQLPYWVQIIQALGPSLAAIVVGSIAGYVAYRQWRTASDRLRFGLFEKRYAMYEKLQDVVATALARGTVGYDDVGTFYRGTRGVEFLFGPEIELYLAEIRDSLGRLAGRQHQIDIGPAHNPNYEIDVKEAHKIKLYLEEQLMKVMRMRFKEYLSLSHLK
jgi:hypothetical protein